MEPAVGRWDHLIYETSCEDEMFGIMQRRIFEKLSSLNELYGV